MYWIDTRVQGWLSSDIEEYYMHFPFEVFHDHTYQEICSWVKSANWKAFSEKKSDKKKQNKKNVADNIAMLVAGPWEAFWTSEHQEKLAD